MGEFESWRQYGEFSHYVRRIARHVLDTKNRRFIDTVLETSEKRKGTIPKGTVLWRAQIGNGTRIETLRGDAGEEIDCVDVDMPFPAERMVPLADRANEGRVNPKGIPCIYFSSDRETAMTETRPWIGSLVSVAQFVMLRELTVVDCTADLAHGGKIYLDGKGIEPEPAVREDLVWGRINRAFSEPVTRTDDVAEYAPTQVLAEAFRSAGYDGIVYGSKLGTGKTVAVFDLAAAELANCHLYRVEAVNLNFTMAANPYYVGKYCKAAQSKEIGDLRSGEEQVGPEKGNDDADAR